VRRLDRALITAYTICSWKNFLLGLYLGSGPVLPMAQAGTVVLILLWGFYHVDIGFWGRIYLGLYANRYGLGIKAKPTNLKKK